MNRFGYKQRLYEAVSVNGVLLDKYVPYFQTLNVVGREGVGRELNTFKVENTDGEFTTGSQLKQRQITVKYKIDAPDDASFRRAYNILTSIIDGNLTASMGTVALRKLNRFSFSDEPSYYFEGVVSEFAEVREGLNSVVSTFTIQCPVPYKYRDLKPVTGSGNMTTPIYPTGGGQAQITSLEFTGASSKLEVLLLDSSRNVVRGRVIVNKASGHNFILDLATQLSEYPLYYLESNYIINASDRIGIGTTYRHLSEPFDRTYRLSSTGVGSYKVNYREVIK